MSTSYDAHISTLRRTQLPQLGEALYLDSAALPPVPLCALDAAHAAARAQLLSNPHSASPSALTTQERIQAARERVCNEVFGVSRRRNGLLTGAAELVEQDVELVFTAGTTASLALVGRCFDFTGAERDRGELAVLREAHTSLLGLRDIVGEERGSGGAAGTRVLREDEVLQWVRENEERSEEQDAEVQEECWVDASETPVEASSPPPPPARGASLLALPVQCNATGRRYLKLISQVLSLRAHYEALRGAASPRRTYLLLDAAAYLSPSTRLPLARLGPSRPDFVAFSFVKLLGSPSGLGGLIVLRQSAQDKLLSARGKQYFGGGAVGASTVTWRIRAADLAAALEDGTPNLLAIIALVPTLDALASEEVLGADWSRREAHVRNLALHLAECMRQLKHYDGAPITRLYRAEPVHEEHGPTLLFSLLTRSGSVVPAAEVARLAGISNIHLRVGRHCNPGAVLGALGVSDEQVRGMWTEGLGCSGEEGEFEQVDGRAWVPSSAVRVSLGVWNTREDVDRFVSWIKCFFSAAQRVLQQHQAASSSSTTPSRKLVQISLYPIKSCGAQVVGAQGWALEPTGLRYDRAWGIVPLSSSSSGTARILSQKKVPVLARIRPEVDEQRQVLSVRFLDCKGVDDQGVELVLPLASGGLCACTGTSERCIQRADWEQQSQRASLRVCGDTISPALSSCPLVHSRLSDFLGFEATLARLPTPIRGASTGAQGRISKLVRGAASATPLLLSNESPFLAISLESVRKVREWIRLAGEEKRAGESDEEADAKSDDKHGEEAALLGREMASSQEDLDVAAHFRANFLFSSASGPHDAFAEDRATRLQIGAHTFAALGPCRRCEMVALDQRSGARAPLTYEAVARHRRDAKGRVLFGVHLELRSAEGEEEEEQACLVRPGDKVLLL